MTVHACILCPDALGGGVDDGAADGDVGGAREHEGVAGAEGRFLVANPVDKHAVERLVVADKPAAAGRRRVAHQEAVQPRDQRRKLAV